ncbi:MAG: hypothetical protein IKN57_06170, partial [Parasporobacterium sp.]|nr:hypothetical protein [Parasporobacterium sp.]
MSYSIKDYEFTKRSAANLRRITSSKWFEEKDSEVIFEYLRYEAEVVFFGDFLKRYIYEKSGESLPFSEVPEEYYVSVISDSFAMNRAPHSFVQVKTKWKNIIKRWLRERSAGRDTVFLLGFGLNMTDEDVSMFLMKVLKEQDFCFTDRSETIYWYCFHHGLPYAAAVSLLSDTSGSAAERNPRFWEKNRDSLKIYLSNQTMLRDYLAYLDHEHVSSPDTIYEEFRKLFDQAVLAAEDLARGKDLMQDNGRLQSKGNKVRTGNKKEEDRKRQNAGQRYPEEEDTEPGNAWQRYPEERDTIQTDEEQGNPDQMYTGAYDIENVLYGGIPRTMNKNLTPATKSLLTSQFGRIRLD